MNKWDYCVKKSKNTHDNSTYSVYMIEKNILYDILILKRNDIVLRCGRMCNK